MPTCVKESRVKEMGEALKVNDALSTVTWTDVMKLRKELKKTSMARFYEANPASSVNSVYCRDKSALLQDTLSRIRVQGRSHS